MECPILAGFILLKVLLAFSNANAKRPKRYKRQRCSFSNILHMKDTQFPSSVLFLISDILVAIHPVNDGIY